jgi:hypothetical protein
LRSAEAEAYDWPTWTSSDYTPLGEGGAVLCDGRECDTLESLFLHVAGDTRTTRALAWLSKGRPVITTELWPGGYLVVTLAWGNLVDLTGIEPVTS